MPQTKNHMVPVNGRRLAYHRKHSDTLIIAKGELIEERLANGQRRLTEVPSQYDLSRASRVSRSYISEIEKGLKQPSFLVASALATAIGVGLDDLIS